MLEPRVPAARVLGLTWTQAGVPVLLGYRDGGERNYFVLTRRGAQCFALRFGCSSRLGLAGAGRELWRFAPGLVRLKELRRRTRKEDALMNEWTELQGPVLKVNGQLMLLVPLEDGGAEFVDCARGVSEVEGPHLKIAIPDWLAGMLRIDEGDIVCVSNWDGKLQIRPSETRLVQ
jgi:hypothetical protein